VFEDSFNWAYKPQHHILFASWSYACKSNHDNYCYSSAQLFYRLQQIYVLLRWCLYMFNRWIFNFVFCPWVGKLVHRKEVGLTDMIILILIYQIDSTLNNLHSARWALLMYKHFSFMQSNLVFFTSLYWWQIYFHQLIGSRRWSFCVYLDLVLGKLITYAYSGGAAAWIDGKWRSCGPVACDSCAREELLLACIREKKQSFGELRSCCLWFMCSRGAAACLH